MSTETTMERGVGMNKEAKIALPAHETVYRALRDLVLFGGLAPGDPVTIQGLVARLGAGMTPVREALRRLTAEGALDALGNRRIMVPVLDAARLQELTQARLALEPLLARRAVPNMLAEDVARLKAIDQRLDAEIAQGDVSGYLRENHAFHAALHDVAKAPILSALTETLWLRFGPSLRVVVYDQLDAKHGPDRHKELLVAIRENDADAAAQAIADDIRQGMSLIADRGLV